MSQQDLSGRLAQFGIPLDRSGVSRTENQERVVPDFEFYIYCELFKKSPEEFFEFFNAGHLKDIINQKTVTEFPDPEDLLKVAEGKK